MHLSPSRLHVHLLFTVHRSSKARLLRNLPPFPILVDYRLTRWTKAEVNLLLAALEHRGRVRGISLGSRIYKYWTNVLEVLGRHFPELESFEIGSGGCPHRGPDDMELPETFLLGSASRLRRLNLQDAEPRYLSALLSTATGLVDLSLTIKIPLSPLTEESLIQSLIANLQRMPCLRRLELGVSYPLFYQALMGDGHTPLLPSPTGDIVPLPNLMELVLTGEHIYLEALVATLAAPSLRYLNADFTDATHRVHIPHLCRLICDAEHQFRLVHMDFSNYELRITAETHSKSVHAQPFRISIPGPRSLEEIGNMLSGPLATVEKLVIRWNGDGHHIAQWRGVLNHTRQVKLLQVSWQVARDVAKSFQQDDQEPDVSLLPTLEQVKMDMSRFRPQEQGAIPDAFGPLIAAWKKMGRPITLSHTDVNWVETP